MSVELTILGSGTSAGVPMIGCDCPVCTSADPRDRRDRPGALVRYRDPAGRLCTYLIDTPPDLRHQMIRHAVWRIDGVVYTHHHADHILGIDDLRRFNAVMNQSLPIYAEPRVLDRLGRMFAYIFDPAGNVNPSFVAQLLAHPIDPDRPLELSGRPWQPLRLLHGKLPILGFRIGSVAYCTDCSAIPPQTWPLLDHLDILVIDALRFRHHPTHMTVQQALEVIEQVRPRRAYLTHLAHDIRHAEVEPTLPEHVFLAYDGLTLRSGAEEQIGGAT